MFREVRTETRGGDLLLTLMDESKKREKNDALREVIASALTDADVHQQNQEDRDFG